MGKAGGIIALISGVFAVIAAIVTLLVGGVGAAVDAKEAGSILAYGWLGLGSAFLVIVFGAIAIFRSNVGAFSLLVLSLVGAVVGGTIVGICMALAFVGGILAAIGSKDAATGKRDLWPWSGLPLGVVLAVTIAKATAQAVPLAAPALAHVGAASPPPLAAASEAVPSSAVVTTAAQAEPVAEEKSPADIAAGEFEAADKVLNHVYQQAMTARGDAEKSALRDAQRAWIKQRDSECEEDQSAGIGPNSAGALEAMSCRTRMTQERTTELRAL